MKIRYIIIITVILFTACKNQNTYNIKTDEKHELRIVSLVPSVTKELQLLGLEDNIVGATSYCDISKNNKNLIVGSAIETNEEKVLLLKPDVVFVSSLTKQATIDVLKKNGLNVYVYAKARSFNDICKHFIEIAEYLDRGVQAEIIVNKAQNKVDSLKNTIVTSDKKLNVFFQLGANPLATVIPNTFMDDYITLAACNNIFNDLNKIIINKESVILRNPDVILIVEMGTVAHQEKENWYKFDNLNAVKNDKVFIVQLATTPTVTNFTNVFENIINFIYDTSD